MYKPLCRECFNDETLIKEMREHQLETTESDGLTCSAGTLASTPNKTALLLDQK